MILTVDKSDYAVPANCEITTIESYVFIDEVDSPSFTFENKQPFRLVILFDKDRTARWFAELIRSCLQDENKRLEISKLTQWENSYPFGYQYIYY